MSAAVTAAVGAAASAQQAVQWRVEDGGNGHWYLATDAPTGDAALVLAISMGGHLVDICNAAENEIVKSLLLATGKQWAWLGLRQSPGQPVPDAGWYWVTGEPCSYLNWTTHDGAFPTGAPDDSPCGLPPWGVENDQANQGAMQSDGRWDDLENGAPTCGSRQWNNAAIIEWSADCNNDGIVDYGQILSGELVDSDGNFVPDCCGGGPPCPNSPRQWTLEQGGNGHWYAFDPSLRSWQDARVRAIARGGDLASLSSTAERLFWMSMIPEGAGPSGCTGCTWLGGFQDRSVTDYAEPSGGWRWSDGTPWTYTFWNPGEPNNLNVEDYLYGSGPTNGRWNDSSGACCAPSVIEWSADCNNDGIVDYGQILSGQLVDADTNGVPDTCECPCDVFPDNAVNGIDLGVLLGQWGEVTQYTVTDFNRDGAVDGIDLGQLLAVWGPCPS
jgi:C-type mannose receptor